MTGRADSTEEVERRGDPEDAWLVELARAGDERAFERLVRKHLDWALAMARSLLPDADDADDAVQLAFVSALECLDDCRNPNLFRRWFRTIVRRTALNCGKRSAGGSDALVEGLPDGRADSAERARMGELYRHLRRVLRKLSPLQGRVFVLHDMDGYSHNEIADELSISPGSSRVHLHGARRALRAKLQPLYREETTDG